MADAIVPHFANDQGEQVIHIGVKEFKCMGARAPYDHPHVYLDMGGDSEIICPYCSTLFKLDTSLHADQSVPPGCFVGQPTAA
ncbi:MAG: zinc-finger domain-containing protein [Alphaproteobacteria bacterium]